MSCFGNAAGFLSYRACCASLSMRCGGLCLDLLRYRHQYSSHSHDVACCHGELEVLINALHPPIHGLADAADGFAPAEVLLDALSDTLAQRVADAPSGACVNCTAAAPGSVAQLGKASMKVDFEAKDAVGMYKVLATVKDKVSGRTLDLTTPLKVE